MMRRSLMPIAAALLLAGCAHSPPTTILTLDAAPPAPGAVRASYRGAPIAVPAVHLPAVLDRAELVRQDGAGRVKVDDFARWAAPLGLLARDTLTRDLIARLPAGSVLPPGSVGGGGAKALGVTVLAFDASPSGARMEVAWRVLPDGRVRDVTLTAPATPDGPAGTAQAFGTLLGQLADRIAADLPG